RKTALKLRNEVRRLCDMKSARGDEQDVIGTHKTVSRVYGGAFDDRQNIALHTFPAYIRTMAGFTSGNLIDFVEKNNSVVLDAFDGQPRDLIHIDELLFLFLDEIIERFNDLHFALLGALPEEAGQDIFDIDIHFLDALIADDFEGWEIPLLHFDLT